MERVFSEEKALEFQKMKAYERQFESSGNKGKLIERCEVDAGFVAAGDAPASGEERVPFDAYLIAEGGWSDSTRRLGFSKVVVKANPRIGLVINMVLDPKEPATKDPRMRSTTISPLDATGKALKEKGVLVVSCSL